jgi:hypothetical protein
MADWTRSRLAGLRQRISSVSAHATADVPTQVGGPFVTETDIGTAGQGIQDILAAYHSGTATEGQLRAIWAVNDANADAHEQRERAAAYGAGVNQGYQAGYDPRAAEAAGDYDPDPDLGPET